MKVTCTCGTEFEARSAKARYCSDRCRKRKNKGAEIVELAASKAALGESDSGPVESATARELADSDRLETALGQACLTLARRLDNPGLDTGSAMSAVAGRLEAMLAAATRGAAKATSPQQLRDELAARRAKHA